MNSGTLSWSEMAMVHLRLKVAEEFELGPSRQRRGRVSRGGNKADDGFEAMDVIEAEGPVVSVTSSGPVSTAFNNTASRQSMESWHPIRCPLYTEDKDVVTKSDVLRNLSKRTKLRYAGGFYMEKLGDSLFRAKLNLPSK